MPIALHAIQRLRTQHQSIHDLIAGCSLDDLARRPSPNTWSIREHLAHLGRYQEVFIERIDTISTGETPAFERYRAEDDPGFADWCVLDDQALPAGIEEGRGRVIELVAGLDDGTLALCGRHPLFGAIDIRTWCEFFLLHEAHHLYAVLKLAGAWRQGA